MGAPTPARALDDDAREHYCQARARGMSSRAAARLAEVPSSTAGRWSKDPDIRARIRYLKDEETCPLPDAGTVIRDMRRIIIGAEQSGAYKAAIDGTKWLYQAVQDYALHGGEGEDVDDVPAAEDLRLLASGSGDLGA